MNVVIGLCSDVKLSFTITETNTQLLKDMYCIFILLCEHPRLQTTIDVEISIILIIFMQHLMTTFEICILFSY